jgi:DNA polymerase-3 subunit gamma/tau
VSHQVLARKLRPRTFDEVVGQSHVTTPLRNALKSGRIPHAILLTGPRGTGKTTLARIFACCLNAEKGPTDRPDPDDPACREIAAGTSTDVQEIDAASRTSVDDVRELVEAVRYAPSPGKWRIYIVDEVHMLSAAAFNALLKTLEEPPPRSLFLFCTTNPEKIPFTVVSRCQRYDLRRIPTAEVARYLGEVARAEGIGVSEASLLAIARAGEGSLRDSLTLLDQLLAHGGGEAIDDEKVAQVLDLVDARVLLAIGEGCVDGDAPAALAACRRAFEAGIDARRLGGALLALLRDLVVVRVAPEHPELVEGSDAHLEALRALAARTEEARLRRMFRALLREQEDLTWAPEPFAVLEMALVRLATLPSGDEVAQLLARLDALERRLRGEAPEGGAAPAAGGSRGRAAPPRRGGAGPAEAAPLDEARGAEPEAAQAAPARETPAAAELESGAHDGPAAVENLAADPPAPLPVVFDRLRALARERDRMLWGALEDGRLAARDAAGLTIAVSTGVAARRLEARRSALEALCESFFGRRVQVAIEAPAAAAGARPVAAATRDAGRLRQQALEHPALNDALEILGAEIVEIRPLGQPGEPA